MFTAWATAVACQASPIYGMAVASMRISCGTEFQHIVALAFQYIAALAFLSWRVYCVVCQQIPHYPT